MQYNLKWSLLGCVIALCLTSAHDTSAQNTYPVRPIRILVPFPAGGAADVIGRSIGDQLSGQVGQPVVIDNRPGAGGRLATELLVNANPDGYTLLVGTVGGISISPALYRKLSYDPARDILSITHAAEIINVLAVPTSINVSNVREFIDWVKGQPAEVRFGTSGTGQPDHLAGELFRRMAAVRMTYVPYKGGGPALVDLISGDLHLMFATYVVALPHVKSGRLRMLAVTTPKRQPLLPDLPAIAETLNGFGLNNWNGIFAPGKTPVVIADRLFVEINKALQAPEVRKRQAAAGIEPGGSPSREAFARFVHEETARWAKVVKDADIVVE
ncbi:MAG: tripartite tricarboxylate transporter substrate binding protein [Proteobacteria bacterium]|nr:tripartite tricarboxylate transporter substrate binding protein [Burkholderiales bacterium]